jgi:hypothetical protein
VTKWIDALQAEGKSKQKPASKRKATPAPLVNEILVTVRRPSGNDPGQVEPGYYVIEDKSLWVTDKDGIPFKDSTAVTLESEANVRAIASSLIRERWNKNRGGFWRDLSSELP